MKYRGFEGIFGSSIGVQTYTYIHIEYIYIYIYIYIYHLESRVASLSWLNKLIHVLGVEFPP